MGLIVAKRGAISWLLLVPGSPNTFGPSIDWRGGNSSRSSKLVEFLGSQSRAVCRQPIS